MICCLSIIQCTSCTIISSRSSLFSDDSVHMAYLYASPNTHPINCAQTANCWMEIKFKNQDEYYSNMKKKTWKAKTIRLIALLKLSIYADLTCMLPVRYYCKATEWMWKKFKWANTYRIEREKMLTTQQSHGAKKRVNKYTRTPTIVHSSNTHTHTSDNQQTHIRARSPAMPYEHANYTFWIIFNTIVICLESITMAVL